MDIKRRVKHEPYNRFRGALRERGLTYSDVSRALMISEPTVNQKISGVSDFYVSEVDVIEKEFGIPHTVFFD